MAQLNFTYYIEQLQYETTTTGRNSANMVGKAPKKVTIMKNKKKKKKPKYLSITGCKGKKGGCYWEGEPEGITKLRIAA